MATVYTSHRGNLAIEQDNWKLSVDEAKKLVAWMKSENIATGNGSKWHFFVVKPIRSAIAKKAETVRLHTGGFLTADFHNYLSLAKIDVAILPDAQ